MTAVPTPPPAEVDALCGSVLAPFEETFSGGPDTSCRTRWRRDSLADIPGTSEECVEVPMDDLRAAFDAAHQAQVSLTAEVRRLRAVEAAVTALADGLEADSGTCDERAAGALDEETYARNTGRAWSFQQSADRLRAALSAQATGGGQ